MTVAAHAWLWRATGAAALSLAAAGAAADPVSLRPHWRVGDERRYDLSAEYRQSTGEEQDQGAERRTTQSARILIHVSEIDASGGATLQLTFESLHTELTAPGGETGEVFDWKAGGDPAPGTEGKPSDLSRLSQALASCTMVAAIGPDGSVTTLTGLVPLAKALKEGGGDTPALQGLGFFSPVRLRTNLSSLWRADPSGVPRDAGASWLITEHVTLGEAHEADETTTLTLTALEGTVARVAGSVNLTPSKSKREADPSAPHLDVKDQTGTVTLDWDTAAGLLVSRVDDRSATWSATVDLGPGAAIPQVSTESSAVSHVSLTLVK